MLWTPLFFGLKRPVEATVDIVALTGTVGYLTYVWSGVDEVAAWGLAPYLGWLSFATYLCVSTTIIMNLVTLFLGNCYMMAYTSRPVQLTGMITNLGFHRVFE